MWLCNFCAAGMLSIIGLERHWKRQITTCENCVKKKSCQEVDIHDENVWEHGRPVYGYHSRSV